MNPALDSRARFEAWAKAQPGYQPGHLSRWSAEARAKEGQYCDPVMEFAWQAAIASMAVPEGWVLVPEESTEAMDEAGGRHVYEPTHAGDCEQVWRAMVKAAPKFTPQDPPIAALAAKETPSA